ncbi:MAG: UDP-N-acetylglucosamine 2-epimerase (hydrolyzing) [Muribaculaceae bacterium]|nr:UDP-N-acetylglucosamine 2-epimerase (hydrolyzing) [Muribaculaceae bacterium]
MKKICFITGTRADYGIMAPIMREIEKSPEACLQIIATNMHLSPDFGMTVNEIESDGFKVDVKIESLVPGSTPASTVRSMAKVEEGLAEAFELLQPDLVVILGDRYEALASASAAVVFNIPIAHLHGGETTEGAIDDAFRHAITKLSNYHFASTPQYAEKIISMGEDPTGVFLSGAPGAEITGEEIPGLENELNLEFEQKTGINPWEPFIIFAMHPSTMLPDKGLSEVKATLTALDPYINQGYKILVTMPNSDPGSTEIFKLIEKWITLHSQSSTPISLVSSLGSRLFHYALERASAIIGNSSAALIEAPSHRLPAVNVGVRQKGRAHGMTVIDAPGDSQSIGRALSAALSLEMKAVLMGLTVSSLNPYYKESSSSFIAQKLIEIIC